MTVRSFIALLVGMCLVIAGCGADGTGDVVSTTATATTTTTRVTTTDATSTATTSTTLSPTTTTAVTPSQSPTDAARDGVVAEVALMPMSARVLVVDEVVTDEGVWAISKMPGAADAYAEGCRIGDEAGKYPTDFICTIEYGEVLLLSADRSTILRAYPLPGVPAEHVVVTDEAVYCGHHGELPMPDSMVCRIDRTTMEAIVRVYQPGLDSLIVQPCFFPPDSWAVIEQPLEVKELWASAGDLFAADLDGTWTQIDGTGLTVVARGVAAPEGTGS